MDFSVARSNALALFTDMLGRKCLVAEEYVLFGGKVVAASELFAEFSLVSRLELKRVDFPKEYWCFVKKHLVPFVELGWVTPKDCEAFVVHKEKFDNVKLREKVARKKGPKGPKQVIIERRSIIRDKEEAPILQRADYAHIFVDFPNFSKEKLPNGRPAIRPEDIDWRKFKHQLSLYHGIALPVAGATLFVAGEYLLSHADAFNINAKTAGFEIVPTEGKDDVDTRVQAAFTDASIDHLEGYANLPVISLLSGDKDYRHHLQVIKRQASKKGLSLRLKITSWRAALSFELRALATDEPTYVEEILSSIYPSALDRVAA